MKLAKNGSSSAADAPEETNRNKRKRGEASTLEVSLPLTLSNTFKPPFLSSHMPSKPFSKIINELMKALPAYIQPLPSRFMWIKNFQKKFLVEELARQSRRNLVMRECWTLIVDWLSRNDSMNFFDVFGGLGVSVDAVVYWKSNDRFKFEVKRVLRMECGVDFDIDIAIERPCYKILFERERKVQTPCCHCFYQFETSPTLKKDFQQLTAYNSRPQPTKTQAAQKIKAHESMLKESDEKGRFLQVGTKFSNSRDYFGALPCSHIVQKLICSPVVRSYVSGNGLLDLDEVVAVMQFQRGLMYDFGEVFVHFDGDYRRDEIEAYMKFDYDWEVDPHPYRYKKGWERVLLDLFLKE